MIDSNFNFTQVSNLAVPADFSPAAPAQIGNRATHLATVSGRARGSQGPNVGALMGGPMQGDA